MPSPVPERLAPGAREVNNARSRMWFGAATARPHEGGSPSARRDCCCYCIIAKRSWPPDAVMAQKLLEGAVAKDHSGAMFALA